jgi:hypothetical protein
MKIHVFPPSGRVVGIVATDARRLFHRRASSNRRAVGAAGGTLLGDPPLVRGLGLTACLAGRACGKRCRAGVVALQEGGPVTAVSKGLPTSPDGRPTVHKSPASLEAGPGSDRVARVIVAT